MFCGAGGLTHGLIKSGIPVVAGFDVDETCRYAFEKNNDSIFINKDIRDLNERGLEKFYGGMVGLIEKVMLQIEFRER